MNDEPDEDADEKIETYRQFAATRSNQDSKLSNENLKAAAQAAILINGGAASALLAFLSKETPIRRTDQLQTMLRNLGLTFLLLASAGPASATDPSAMEETNCLMACDANQQNCQATGQVSTERNYSFAQHSPLSKLKSAVVRSRQMIQLPEAHEIARVPH